MNYTQEGRRYIADAGYVFALKTNHESTAEVISIKLIDYYDCIPEPIPEPEPEPTSLEERVQKLEEDKEPLEAQATFTAVMTDTLLDEEKEEE